MTIPDYFAEKVLEEHWNNTIPVNPIHIAENMGITIYSSQSIEYTGEFLYDQDRPVILFKPSGNSKRDHFVIAHELGHFVMGHEPSHRDTNSSFDISNFIPSERDANYFASTLLMPKSCIEFAIHRGNLTSVEELCDYFDVSTTAMRIRLKNLGIL